MIPRHLRLLVTLVDHGGVVGPGDPNLKFGGVAGHQNRKSHGRGEEGSAGRGGLGGTVVVALHRPVHLIEGVVPVVVGPLLGRRLIGHEEARQVPLGRGDGEDLLGVCVVVRFARARAQT